MTTEALETLQLAENKHLCEDLVASGDRSNLARIIVHKLEFISEYKKSDLLEALEERGFTINETFVTEEGYNGLMFQREDITESHAIETLTLELIGLLDVHDARYGGWITQLVA